MTITAWAPGRVNLIGDHTDYMGGLVLPMAVQMGTTVTGELDGPDDVHEEGPDGPDRVGLHPDPVDRSRPPVAPGRLVLTSDRLDGTVDVGLPVADPTSVEPRWGRYAAGVAEQLGRVEGARLDVRSDLPIGGGLSSSASLEVAVALVLGAGGTPLEIARLCQRAEQGATGVPCGIMDQLAVAAGVDGHALLIDCATDAVTPVRVPSTAAIWVVDSGQPRELAGSDYATRRAQAEAAAAIVGPLPLAPMADIDQLADPVARARARHVRTECDRVRAFAAALAADDLRRAGELMVESHRSLRDDYEVSTPVLDGLVDRLVATPGVHGARLTGAGFGGCVVALADDDVVLEEIGADETDLDGPGTEVIRVHPSAGAAVIVD